MEYASHIDKSGKIQTNQEHCFNTAALCSEYTKSIGMENTGKIQGLLHDAGKFTSAFNNYIRGNSSMTRGQIDHSYAGAKYISAFGRKNGFEKISDLIGRTIISHHGIHDWVDNEGKNYFFERTGKSDGYDEIIKNLKLMLPDDELIKLLALADSELNDVSEKINAISKKADEKAFYYGMLERMLQSALIDADCSDTANFMNGDSTDEIDTAEVWKLMQNRLNKRLAEFSEKIDKISVQRQSISDRCAEFAKRKVGICRLIVPTGGGKTLSSLRFADEYCLLHNMNKIIYTAPFMSILEQNSDEIRKISGDEFFTEHYSDALAELSDNIDSESYRNYELRTERWDSPVIATTMVQLLNTLFSAKKSSVRRMHRLSKAVIIIDEVQSVPLKCVELFNLAMNFLSKVCGAAIVLCSATQPANEETSHPIMLDNYSSMTGDIEKDFFVFQRTKIIPCIDAYGKTYEEAADFCFEKFGESGNLLVVVNTKSAALSIYDLLSKKCDDGIPLIHLSTNMCPEHRREKIRLLRKLLQDNKPVICVTTSLIEAGVDISFKCVVRSLAGLDNSAQAAGRCNRHGESSQPCNVYIIKIRDENLGSLASIKTAQDISLQIIGSGKFDDLQSPEAIKTYFSQLYKKEKNKLSYNVIDDDYKTNLVELLSLNKNRRELCELFETVPDKNASQAFRTAGFLFEVIDSRTVDVIVNYNDEADMIISELEKPNCNLKKLLRKSQKYTVGIYNGTKNKLTENNALRILESGAVVLDKMYYDDVKGVITEGAEYELLIF